MPRNSTGAPSVIIRPSSVRKVMRRPSRPGWTRGITAREHGLCHSSLLVPCPFDVDPRQNSAEPEIPRELTSGRTTRCGFVQKWGDVLVDTYCNGNFAEAFGKTDLFDTANDHVAISEVVSFATTPDAFSKAM